MVFPVVNALKRFKSLGSQNKSLFWKPIALRRSTAAIIDILLILSYSYCTRYVIMRVMDVIMAIPGFLLAVCISSALGQGIFNTALAIGIGCVPGYARLLRALVLGIRDQEYVEAARVTGASNARIMFRQIVPNILSPVIVDSTLRIGGCILMISSLSFIGLGVQPPTAEWGSMVAEGREVIRSFWPMSTFPGLAIMLTLFGFNLFGDGLRDALDPKLKN